MSETLLLIRHFESDGIHDAYIIVKMTDNKTFNDINLSLQKKYQSYTYGFGLINGTNMELLSINRKWIEIKHLMRDGLYPVAVYFKHTAYSLLEASRVSDKYQNRYTYGSYPPKEVKSVEFISPPTSPNRNTIIPPTSPNRNSITPPTSPNRNTITTSTSPSRNSIIPPTSPRLSNTNMSIINTISSPTRSTSPTRTSSPKMEYLSNAAGSSYSSKLTVSELDKNVNGIEMYAVAQRQRRAHEDRYQIKEIGPFRYFAVFDGHGMSRPTEPHVVNYLRDELHNRITEALNNIDYSQEELVKNALIKVFTDFDQELYSTEIMSEEAKKTEKMYEDGEITIERFMRLMKWLTKRPEAGSTATIALIDDIRNKLYVVNLADSRTILFSNGIVEFETKDHEPMEEIERIEKAGGYVFGTRVGGELAVSRAFGDWKYKNIKDGIVSIDSPVTSLPDVTVIDITNKSDKFLLLTSDAPFDSLNTSQELINKLSKSMSSTTSFESALDNLIKTIETTDDSTYILARL